MMTTIPNNAAGPVLADGAPSPPHLPGLAAPKSYEGGAGSLRLDRLNVKHRTMMKTIMLLFGLLLSSSAMAADGALANIDSSRIRTIALASITAKHPEINESKLVFESIQYSLSASNTEVIAVTYRIPSSAEATTETKDRVPMVRTKTETISVRMSILGKVQNVSKGSSMRISTTSQ
jgi:hypothetical protein